MTVDIALPALGIRVDALSFEEVLKLVSEAADAGDHLIIGNHNMHSAYLAASSERFRDLCASFHYRLVDGFPILVLASVMSRRWLGGRRRLGSLDWVPAAVSSGRLKRIAVVGATRDSNEGAVRALRRLSTASDIRGWPGDRWSAEKGELVIIALQEFQPELVLVGLGMPLQEEFLAEHLDELPNAVYATVGGAIDQISGHQRPAPRWIGRFGVEWIWRFASQPRRLAHRYFVEPLLLVRLALQHASRRVR